MEEDISKRERHKLNREKGLEEKKPSVLKDKLLVIIFIVVLALGAFWFMYKSGQNGGGNNNTTTTAVSVEEVRADDHIKGPENASVVLIEYGDFQCPACGAYSPIVAQISDIFKDDLKVVFRHFPLRTIHQHAEIAAQASEAANEQGKFWEMHDKLFEKQEEWTVVRDPRNLFKEYAGGLGLNVDAFDKFMNSSDAKARVDKDYASAVTARIDSTPTFYLNGEKLESPQGLEPFRAIIQAKIDELKKENPEATSSGEASPAGSITPQL